MGRYNRNPNYTAKKKFAKPQNKPKTPEAQDNFDKHNLSDVDQAKLNKDAK